MFQRQMGLNGVLDLMKGETEFTPPTQGLSSPKKCILRGKYRDQCGSVFALAGRLEVSSVAMPENCGRRV